MSQQKPGKTQDDVYKRKLFYDNGVQFVRVKARLTGEYKPPTPIMKSQVNTNLQSSAGLVSQGTAYYTTTIQLLFSSKNEYADWEQFKGAQHKFYDEKGSIFVGIVHGDVDLQTVEMETKYMVTVNLALIRKQEFELRRRHSYVDIEDHWAKKYIEEMHQRGLIPSFEDDGTPVQYFQPEVWISRAQVTTYLVRTYKHIDKLLRGN